jgi:hypothetical protein
MQNVTLLMGDGLKISPEELGYPADYEWSIGELVHEEGTNYETYEVIGFEPNEDGPDTMTALVSFVESEYDDED